MPLALALKESHSMLEDYSRSLERYRDHLEDLVAHRTRELQESEQRYRTLFEDSPISLWEEDFSDVKKHIDNLRASGIEDLAAFFDGHPEEVKKCAELVKLVDVNKSTLELYKAESIDEFRNGLNTVLGDESYNVFKEELLAIAEGKTHYANDAVNYTLDGERRDISISWSVPPGHERALSKILISIVDITERKRSEDALHRAHDELEQRVAKRTAELVRANEQLEMQIEERRRVAEVLRESEEKYRGIFENTPIGIFQSSLGGNFLSTNPACAKMLGYESPEEIVSTITDIAHQLYVEPLRWEEIIDRLLGGTASVSVENNYYRKDGSMLAAKLTLWPVHNRDGSVRYLEGFIEDLTGRKKTEEDLLNLNERLIKEHEQRKLLSKRLIELLEMDRKRIAMELHDQIGQTLTTLKMDMELISCRMKKNDPTLLEALESAQQKAVQAIRGLKDIAYGLRPSILDNLGLIPSIHYLVNDIKKSSDIEVHFFSRNLPKRFDQEKETTIYRVIQEALCNVLKHARARNVFISLVSRDGVLSLSVEDDGVGFQPENVMQNRKENGSLGILIMQERVIQLDGDLSIESRLEAGTHIWVEIPL